MTAQAHDHALSARAGGRSVRVLVVDDDGIVRRGLRALLARDGSDVADAASGEAALHRLRSFGADVVVMDADLPGMSGIEATRRLAHEAPSAAVLMLSIAPDPELVLGAIRAGSAGLLLKDAAYEQIIAGVRAVAAGNAILDTRVACVIANAVHGGDGAECRPAPGAVLLSDPERELLALLTHGLNNAAIGRRLVVSSGTVASRRSALMRKLAVASPAQAAPYASCYGMLAHDRAAA